MAIFRRWSTAIIMGFFVDVGVKYMDFFDFLDVFGGECVGSVRQY
jgi:hypothetical protein